MTQAQWIEEKLESWDGVSTDFVPPQPSIYQGKVVSAEPSPTKAGRPQISLEIELKQDLVQDEPASGSLKFQRVLVTTGAGGFRMKQLCESAEVSPPEASSLEAVKDFCETIVGCDVYLRSKLEPKRDDPSISYAGVARYLTADQAQEAASSFASEG